MKAMIVIDMSNAAFNPPDDRDAWTHEGLAEVARILRRLTTKIEADDVSDNLLDTFGNRVGSFLLVPDKHAPEAARSLAINPKAPAQPSGQRLA